MAHDPRKWWRGFDYRRAIPSPEVLLMYMEESRREQEEAKHDEKFKVLDEELPQEDVV